MMENPTIKLYNLLRTKNFNEEEAASVIDDIERTVDKKFEANAERFATKKDIMDLKDGMDVKISDLNNNINNLFWKITGVMFGQMGLIFLILKLVGVFGK